MGKKNNLRDVDEAEGVEIRLFCHTHRLRRYPYAEIAKLATIQFGRPFTAAKVSALCSVELAERMALDEHVADRLRFAVTEELDALARVVAPHLAASYLDEDGVTKRTPAAVQLSAVREYRGLLQDRAKLLGLNAAEKVEATVVVVTPQDPAVQALILEAERALTEGLQP